MFDYTACERVRKVTEAEVAMLELASGVQTVMMNCEDYAKRTCFL